MARKKHKITLAKFGSDGKVQIGERTFPDPLEPGMRIQAKVNVRECAIDHLASRGRLNASQEVAGQRFRKLWEMAAVGRNQAMDTSKEPVDGGSLSDPISDELVKASIELKRILSVTGAVGSKLLIAIVGEGKRIEDVALQWAEAGGIVRGRYAHGYVTGRMIEALDDLVRHWGLESKAKNTPTKQTYKRNGVPVTVVSRPILADHDTHTGPVTELEVGRFGDVVEKRRRPMERRDGQRSGTA